MKNRAKLVIALSLIFVFAAGFFLGWLVDDRIFDRRSRRRPESKAHFPTFELITRELSLTAEQQQKFREIFQANDERLKQLRGQHLEQFRTLRSQLMTELKSVLSEEQKAKFEAMIENYYAARRAEYEKREKQKPKPAPKK